MASLSDPLLHLLGLPEGIRLLVYEYLSETCLRPLIHRAYHLYFQDSKVPTSALLIKKEIYGEIKPLIEGFRRQQVPAVVCCLVPAYYASAVNRMIATAKQDDDHFLSHMSDKVLWEDKDRLGPRADSAVLDFRDQVQNIRLSRDGSRLPWPLLCNATPLKDFLFLSLMKMRWRRTAVVMQFRCLIVAENNSTLNRQL